MDLWVTVRESNNSDNRFSQHNHYLRPPLYFKYEMLLSYLIYLIILLLSCLSIIYERFFCVFQKLIFITK